MISRRALFGLLTGGLATVGLSKFALSGLSMIPKNVCVNAKDMKARAVAFRKNFVSKYLEKNVDYPIFEIMLSSNMMPIDNRDADKLGQRGVFKVSNITGGQPNSRLLSNSTGSSIEPRFLMLFNDQAIRARFRIPKPINIKTTFDNTSLFLEFSTALLITIEDEIMYGGLPLGISKDQILKSISLSDDFLIYKFVDKVGSPLTIKLDFTDQGCSTQFSTLSAFNIFSYLIVMFLFISSIFTLNACCTGSGCHKPPGPKSCDIAQCPAENEFIVRSAALATNGVLNENGKYYFAHLKKLENPTQWSFVRADDLPVKCQLKICADVDPGQNWFEMKSYYDKDDCDKSPDQSKPNVKIVRRCYDSNLIPELPLLADGSVSIPDASINVDYSQTFKAGDNAPNTCPVTAFQYSVTKGNLPVGIKLNGNRISGKSITAGIYKFTITAKANDTGCPFSQDYTLKVN